MNEKYAEAANLAVFYVRSADIVGDIGEFGTHGVTSQVIVNQIANTKSKKNVHLFDSFEGSPPRNNTDKECYHVLSGAWRQYSSCGRVSPIALRRRLEKKLPANQVHIYEGHEGAIILFSDWNANRAFPSFGSRKALIDILEKFDINYRNSGTYCWGGKKILFTLTTPECNILTARYRCQLSFHVREI